jgi:ankyrin repeat protein
MLNYFLLCLQQNGYTALIIAAENGDFQIVKLLMENNADINFHNKVFF